MYAIQLRFHFDPVDHQVLKSLRRIVEWQMNPIWRERVRLWHVLRTAEITRIRHHQLKPVI